MPSRARRAIGSPADQHRLASSVGRRSASSSTSVVRGSGGGEGPAVLDVGEIEKAVESVIRATRTAEDTDNDEDAEAVLDSLREQGVLADAGNFAVVLRVLREKMLVQTAVEFAEELDSTNFELGTAFCAELLKVHAAADDWSRVMELFADMKKYGVSFDIECYNTMLLAIRRGTSKVYLVQSLFSEMKSRGVKPNTASYASLLWSLSSGNMLDSAMETLRVMQVEKVKPDIGCYQPVLQACARLRKGSVARGIFQTLRREGLVPDHFMINNYIRACHEASEENGKLSISDIFRQLESDEGIILTDLHYDYAIHICERQENWQGALAFASRMGQRQVRPLEMTCYSVLHACANLHQWQPALSLLSTLQAEGIDPDEAGYTFAMQACAAKGQWDEIVRMYDGLRARGRTLLEAETVGPIMAALSETGRTEDALALFIESRDAGSLKLWRQRRLALGPRVLDASDVLPQVAGIAVRMALQEASTVVDGNDIEPVQALRRSLAGVTSTRPEDLVVVLGTQENQQDNAGCSVTASVLAVVREVLGDDVEVERHTVGKHQCLRITGSQIEALLVRRVQKAVSAFTPGSKQVPDADETQIVDASARPLSI